MVRDEVLYTPELTSALEGITRATVIILARDIGLKVVEKSIARDEIYVADEAFLTGTAAEVAPIRELDNCIIGNNGRGPITERLQSLYFDHVYGRGRIYPHWNTLVENS